VPVEGTLLFGPELVEALVVPIGVDAFPCHAELHAAIDLGAASPAGKVFTEARDNSEKKTEDREQPKKGDAERAENLRDEGDEEESFGRKILRQMGVELEVGEGVEENADESADDEREDVQPPVERPGEAEEREVRLLLKEAADVGVDDGQLSPRDRVAAGWAVARVAGHGFAARRAVGEGHRSRRGE